MPTDGELHTIVHGREAVEPASIMDTVVSYMAANDITDHDTIVGDTCDLAEMFWPGDGTEIEVHITRRQIDV